MHHLEGLGAALDGELHMPTSPGYDAARRPALFEDMPPDRIELELLCAQDGAGVLRLRYRMRAEAWTRRERATIRNRCRSSSA